MKPRKDITAYSFSTVMDVDSVSTKKKQSQIVTELHIMPAKGLLMAAVLVRRQKREPCL